MNYLDIINKCLYEMNYKQVNDIAELTKTEHKRLLSAINTVNKEVCNIENWNFLLKRNTAELPEETGEIDIPVNGKILHIFIDGEEYSFCENLKPFLTVNNRNLHKYSILNDKLLFKPFKENKQLDIIYYTKNCVIDENNQEKEDFENAADKSLIPMPFAEQVLVYGACLRVKGNPQYFKFSYWLSMYKEALLNLKSKTSISAQNSPEINLLRG